MSGPERSPAGYIGKAAQPYLWFWRDTLCRSWAQNRNAQEGQQGKSLGDKAVLILALHGRLHTIIENLPCRTPTGVKGLDVTAHHRVQFLVRTEPTPKPA